MRIPPLCFMSFVWAMLLLYPRGFAQSAPDYAKSCTVKYSMLNNNGDAVIVKVLFADYRGMLLVCNRDQETCIMPVAGETGVVWDGKGPYISQNVEAVWNTANGKQHAIYEMRKSF